jgi:hypothetical protein
MRIYTSWFAALLAPSILIAFPAQAGSGDELPVTPQVDPGTTLKRHLGFRLIDQRNPAEARHKPLSVWITSCDFYVYQLGENGAAADRLGKLQSALHDSLGDRLRGHEIVVRRYALYQNYAAVGQAWSTVCSYGCRVDASANGARCPQSAMKGGWYAGSEVTGPMPPLIAEVELSVDGKAYSVRAVVSPPTDFWIHRANDLAKPQAAPVNDLIAAANRNVVAAIGPQLSPAPATTP